MLIAPSETLVPSSNKEPELCDWAEQKQEKCSDYCVRWEWEFNRIIGWENKFCTE